MRTGPLLLFGFVLIGVSLSPFVSADAQTPPSPPPPSEAPPRTDSFVETWEQIQADRTAAIERAGQSATAGAIRAIVRNNARKAAVPDYPARNKERVPDLEIEEAVQVLVTAGVPVAALSGARSDADRYIAAARRVASARGTFDDLLLLAPTVAIVSPTEVRADVAPGDGLNTTVVFKVEKVVKGDPASEPLRVRQSLPPGGPAQAEPDPAQRYLVFLSTERYRFAAARKGRSAAQGYSIEVFRPYKIENDLLVPTDPYQPVTDRRASAL